MSSKADIFDRLAESKASASGDVFDRLVTKKKAFGKEGKIIGGQLGGAIETAKEAPSQLFKELPVAATQLLEFPVVQGPKMIADLISKILGPASKAPERETVLSHLTPPQKTKIASQLLADYVREGLPENLKGGAQDIADLETMLLPFLKKLIPEKGIASPEVAKPSEPPPPQPPESDFRAPLSPDTGLGPKLAPHVKQVAEDIKEGLFGPDISQKIPESLSKERIKNTTSAGMELEKAIAKPYEKLSAEANNAYEASKKANKGIEAIHPELVEDLRNTIAELEKIPDPSAPLARYIVSSKKLLKDLAEIGVEGDVIGYKPISNQILIDQIQEYNKIPTFDFPTDTKTGIFKTLIRKLTNAIDKTSAKHPKANAAWKKAKELHARKSELFDDPDVAKWIKLSDKNYSKEFLNSIDIDKIRKQTPVLELSPEGKEILQKMKRDLVEKMFEEYFPVGRRFDKREIARARAELEPILTEEELKMIDQLFEEAQTPAAKAASLVAKFYRFMKRPSSAIKELGNIS